MSYEGYVEYLCANGHYRVFDCREFYDIQDISGRKCSCGAPFVFRHSVDETNGIIPNDPGTQGYPFEVDVPPVMCVCDKCGKSHVIEEVRFKIPTKV